jgi:hypothetical protein
LKENFWEISTKQTTFYEITKKFDIFWLIFLKILFLFGLFPFENLAFLKLLMGKFGLFIFRYLATLMLVILRKLHLYVRVSWGGGECVTLAIQMKIEKY